MNAKAVVGRFINPKAKSKDWILCSTNNVKIGGHMEENTAELKIKKDKWMKDFWEKVVSKGLDRLIIKPISIDLYELGLPPVRTIMQISLCLLDEEYIVAIYPISARKKFTELTRYAGYSERRATDKEITDNQSKVWKKKERAPNADDKRGYTKWDEMPKRGKS